MKKHRPLLLWTLGLVITAVIGWVGAPWLNYVRTAKERGKLESELEMLNAAEEDLRANVEHFQTRIAEIITEQSPISRKFETTPLADDPDNVQEVEERRRSMKNWVNQLEAEGNASVAAGVRQKLTRLDWVIAEGFAPSNEAVRLQSQFEDLARESVSCRRRLMQTEEMLTELAIARKELDHKLRQLPQRPW